MKHGTKSYRCTMNITRGCCGWAVVGVLLLLPWLSEVQSFPTRRGYYTNIHQGLLLQSGPRILLYPDVVRHVAERLSIQQPKQQYPFRVPSSLHLQQPQTPTQQQQQQQRRKQSSQTNNKRQPQRRSSPPFDREAVERNQKIVTLGSQRNIDDLWELFEHHHASFSHVNWATFLMQLQRIQNNNNNNTSRHRPKQQRQQQEEDASRLSKVLWEIAKHMQDSQTGMQWRPREICNVIYAMSKMKNHGSAVAAAQQSIIDHVVQKDEILTDILQRRGNAQEIANFLWAFARMTTTTPGSNPNEEKGYYPKVFATAEQYIDRRVFCLGTCQNIANTLWAYAKQGYDSPVIFRAAERHVVDKVLRTGSPQQISNTVWAYAKQGYDSPIVFRAAERCMDGRVFATGNAQSMANTLWAYAKQGYDSPIVFAAAERHIIDQGGLWKDGNHNSQVFANILWSFAKQHDYDSSKVFQAAEPHMDRVFREARPQAIVNILWAYASTHGYGYESLSVFQTAEQHIDRVFQEGTPQGIANMLWAYGTTSRPSEAQGVFETAEHFVDRVFEHGNSQEIANTLWAFSKQGYESQQVFRSAERGTIGRVFEDGTPQDIATTLWAYATQDSYRSPVVFAAFETHARRIFQTSNTHCIANILWAYGKQGYDSPVVFEACEQKLEKVFADGNSQEIANILWAYAKQGYDSPVVFRAAERHIDRVLQDGTPQEIAKTLWAYATQGFDSPAIFSSVQRHIDSIFEAGSTQYIANILWAFAKQRYDSPEVFGAAERYVDRVFAEGISQDFANILWAYATQGYDSPNVLQAAERHIGRFIQNGNPQEIANTLWAFATQGWTGAADQGKAFLALWNEAKSSKWDQMTDDGKRQLLGAYILTIADLTLDVPEEWLNDSQRLGEKNSESRLQGDVSSILTAIGWDHDLEVDPVPHLIPGYLAIDIACSASKIAIEVDGPSHFLRNVNNHDKRETPAAEAGSTKAKRRLLKRLGWKVINIPYFEWGKLQSAKEKKEYLSSMVAKVATNEVGRETLPGIDGQSLSAADLEGLAVTKMMLVNKAWTKATVANMKAYLKHYDVKGMSGAKKSELIHYIIGENSAAEQIPSTS